MRGIVILAVVLSCADPEFVSSSREATSKQPVKGEEDPVGSSPDRYDAGAPTESERAGADGSINVYEEETQPDGGECVAQEFECADPVDDGCGSDELCNGSDDNCDGQVDEGCPCTLGDVQPCFLGPPGRRGVGACADGSQICVGEKFPGWGACAGGIWPIEEACNSLDDNCNGCADDHPDCCVVPLECPDSDSIPTAAPFSPYAIDGTEFYAGVATSWSWEVSGGPCDQMLLDTSGASSFTVTGGDTSSPSILFTLSGSYTVTMTVTNADGETLSCTFLVQVAGPGLRVELCWDKTGSADLDLHVHRPGTTGSASNWFVTTGSNYNSDDCYYATCTADDYGFFGAGGANWGYGASPVGVCSGTPEGSLWESVGECPNPRLDVDNIATPGIPENTNIDVPEDDQDYRVMVHYYGGSTSTHPMVNVYCGGFLLATYGATPDEVPGFTSGGGFAGGTMWRVADVTPSVDASGTTVDCDLTPLTDPVSGSGYWVTEDDYSY